MQKNHRFLVESLIFNVKGSKMSKKTIYLLFCHQKFAYFKKK